MEVLKEIKQVKANKEHICNWCGGKILKGEKYEVGTFKNDGVIYTWKNHIKCSILVSALDMEGDDGGITEEDFYNSIDEAWRDRIDDEDYEKEGFEIPEFLEKVDFVYKELCKECLIKKLN